MARQSVRDSAAIGELAIRAWPAHHQSLAHVLKIHEWLREAATPDHVPVPVPLPALDGQTACAVQGRCWEITPWMPVRDLDFPPSIDHVRTAFAALARFHLRLNHHQRNEPSPGLRLRLRELQELAGGGFDRL